METTRAVLVHYGPVGPTVVLAEFLTQSGIAVTVVANDLTARPNELRGAADWLLPARNLGYFGALNLVLQEQTMLGQAPDVFIVLNNDLDISMNCIASCLELLTKHPKVGIVGPVLRFDDGTLQSGCASWSRWLKAPRVLNDPGTKPEECDWVTGAAMFIRRQVLTDVGADGSYFLGCEDADLCLRAKRAGWRIMCAGHAPAIHHQSQVISGPRWYYYSARNRVWFVRANFGFGTAVLNWMFVAASLPRIALADSIKRRGYVASKLTLYALLDALRGKPPRIEGPYRSEPMAARAMDW